MSFHNCKICGAMVPHGAYTEHMREHESETETKEDMVGPALLVADGHFIKHATERADGSLDLEFTAEGYAVMAVRAEAAGMTLDDFVTAMLEAAMKENP